jgi:WD40 repeat protein
MFRKPLQVPIYCLIVHGFPVGGASVVRRYTQFCDIGGLDWEYDRYISQHGKAIRLQLRKHLSSNQYVGFAQSRITMLIRSLIRLFTLCLLIFSGVRIGNGQSVAPILEYGRGIPRTVIWSPDGDQLLVVTQTGSLWRYDAHTFETLDSQSGITWAHYSASGDWLFTENVDGTWAIRNAEMPAVVLENGFTFVRSLAETDWLITHDAFGITIRSETDPRHIALQRLEAVYVSPDQQQLLSHDVINGYVLRDQHLAPIMDQPSFPSEAVSVHWSPDGKRLAMVTGVDQVTIVPLSGDESSYILTLPDRERYATLAWSPDSTRLLDYDNVGNAHLWDAESGHLLREIPSGEPYLTPEEREIDAISGAYYWEIYWSADGSHVFRCALPMDTSILCRFYDSHTGEETGQAVGDSLLGSNFTPDMRYFVISSGIFDANTGAVVEDFSGRNIGGYDRIFTRDSRRMATSTMRGSPFTLYDLENLSVEHTLTTAPYLYDSYSMAWSPDGERLVTWGSNGINGAPGSGLITLWDGHTGEEIRRITEHVLFGQEMIFSPDSSRLAAADNVGNIALFDLSSGSLAHMFHAQSERITHMSWQPHGDLLASTTGRTTDYSASTLPVDGAIVQVWNTRSGNLVATLEHEQTVFAMLWHPSGRYLITDDHTGMSIWDVETWVREQIPEMSGNSTAPTVSYHWADHGNVLIRGHATCSGSDSLNFFTVATRHTVGPIGCFMTFNYTWNEAIGGFPLTMRQCDYTESMGTHNCQVAVVVIATDLPNTLVADKHPTELEPAYHFGQFANEIALSPSPDNTRVFVMNDSESQLWRLGQDSAALLWVAEGAQQAIWNHSGSALAIISGTTLNILDSQTGAVRITLLQDIPVDPISITWSPDDAYVWMRRIASVEDYHWIFDTESGELMPLPDDVRITRWMNNYLQLFNPTTALYALFDLHSGQIIASGDQIPMVNSDDGRFGAETRTDVLRVWELGM